MKAHAKLRKCRDEWHLRYLLAGLGIYLFAAQNYRGRRNITPHTSGISYLCPPFMELQEKIKGTVRQVPDFPKAGINFIDIVPVFSDPELSDEIAEAFYLKFQDSGAQAVLGVESRGFLFGLLMAQKLKVPFIPVRKAGKLPWKTVSHEYNLEYGSAKIEMHIDAIQPGWKVLIHDDLLATGGTAAAAAELVQMQNAQVAGFAFMIELPALHGSEKLNNYSAEIFSILKL